MSNSMERHAEKMRRLADAILIGPGELDVEVRRAAQAQAATLGAWSFPSATELPPVIAAFVEKVAKHAYKVTDKDIEELRTAGYSEDAIFEITLSTALGAAMARLQRGLATLSKGR